MSTDSNAATTTARRRIVQLPVRTEAPLALIVGDSALSGELEERLKRAHPVISFPSFSHFLAERPRSTPWVGILVARSGAWDARLDDYVRRRSSIALFALPEESYGWPENVARVRNLEELEPWLTALTAPEPPRIKERPKRATRREAKAALTGLASSWRKPSESIAESASKSDAELGQGESGQAPATSHKPEAVASAQSAVQLELPEVSATRAQRGRRKAVTSRARAAEVAPKAVSVRPHANEGEAEELSEPQVELQLMRLAGELGLARAFELLEELRERAHRVGHAR